MQIMMFLEENCDFTNFFADNSTTEVIRSIIDYTGSIIELKGEKFRMYLLHLTQFASWKNWSSSFQITFLSRVLQSPHRSKTFYFHIFMNISIIAGKNHLLNRNSLVYLLEFTFDLGSLLVPGNKTISSTTLWLLWFWTSQRLTDTGFVLNSYWNKLLHCGFLWIVHPPEHPTVLCHHGMRKTNRNFLFWCFLLRSLPSLLQN